MELLNFKRGRHLLWILCKLPLLMLSVELQDNNWLFAPGDVISGKIVIHKNVWHKIEGLTLRVYGAIEFGKQRVNSSPLNQVVPEGQQQEGRNRGVKTVVLLDHTINLLHSYKVLQPGRSEFDFRYELPTDRNLLPSLKVHGGQVYYEFKSTWKGPRDDYQIYQSPFYVRPNWEEYFFRDYEQNLKFVDSTSDANVFQLFGWCFQGLVSLNVKLEKSVFGVGEPINFTVSVRNELRYKCEPVQVAVVRKFLYKSANLTAKDILTESKSSDEVPAHEMQLWNSALQIPISNCGVTNFSHTDVYEISYYFKAQTWTKTRPRKEVQLKVPVVIIPANVANSVPLTGEATAPPLSPVADESFEMPPPTYSEAIDQLERNDSSAQLMAS